MQANNKIAFNTGILYLRILITSGITLFSTRLLLDILGEEDYGIYNLVNGVVLFLAFLNSAMVVATQRFLSYHQGDSDGKMRTRIFTGSLILHFCIAILLAFILFFLEFFLFDGFLNIPVERISAARMIYRFMIVALVVTILSTPFSALLNARENMLLIVAINILESILKLVIAWLLYCVLGDRLIIYSSCVLGIFVVSFLFYAIYCLKNYNECSLDFKKHYDSSLIKKLLSFAGWNLFGSLCGVGRSQGLPVILNLFFGAGINSAYAIANQVSAQLSYFSSTIMQSFNPQIMRSEGLADRQKMLRLSMTAGKFSFFLMAFFAIPCVFEMSSILSFWLKSVPGYCVVFCTLILLVSLVNQLTVGLQSAVQATGCIQIYQMVVGGLLLLNLPLAYLLLRSGFPAWSVLGSAIVIEFLACAFRLFFLKRIAGLSITDYFRRVFFREFFPILSLFLTSLLITSYVDFKYRFFITFLFSGLIFIPCTYLTGLCQNEKSMINELVGKLIHKIKK